MKSMYKINKLFYLLIVFLQELFTKRNVVFMSAFFDNNYRFLKQNWGDDINWWFLREISVTPIVSYDWSLMARYLGKENYRIIGSILSMRNTQNSVVWGSGFIDESTPLAFTPKRVLAVRGPLTRKRLLDQGIDCPEVYGDPALLLPLYYQPQVVKKYRLGIIPHYTDKGNAFIEKMKTLDDVLVIEIAHYEHWLDFVDQINMCENIASSSLHGQIIAQAYGIPNLWMKMGDAIQGGDFKYHDFFLSQGFDREAVVVTLDTTKEILLAECKKWHPSTYDIRPLFEAAPFILKRNYKISR